jgi:hypothetical protein
LSASDLHALVYLEDVDEISSSMLCRSSWACFTADSASDDEEAFSSPSLWMLVSISSVRSCFMQSRTWSEFRAENKPHAEAAPNAPRSRPKRKLRAAPSAKPSSKPSCSVSSLPSSRPSRMPSWNNI